MRKKTKVQIEHVTEGGDVLILGDFDSVREADTWLKAEGLAGENTYRLVRVLKTVRLQRVQVVKATIEEVSV